MNIWSNQGIQMKMAAITIVFIICVLTLVYIHYNRLSTIAMVIWTVPVAIILTWGALSPNWNKPFGYLVIQAHTQVNTGVTFNQRSQMMMVAIIIAGLLILSTTIYMHFYHVSLIYMICLAATMIVLVSWALLSPSWNKPFSDAVKLQLTETEYVFTVKEE